DVHWEFITPRAPWKGGLYERLVGVTKQCFRRVVGRRLLTEEELRTLITEIESVVNSRPLTSVTDDKLLALRPIDFLSPLAANYLQHCPDSGFRDPEYKPPSDILTADKLQRMWEKSAWYLSKFWELWYIDYMSLLRERVSWNH
ncbi:hypothetical protein Tcan_01264, partial [Toxocara canis]